MSVDIKNHFLNKKTYKHRSRSGKTRSVVIRSRRRGDLEELSYRECLMESHCPRSAVEEPILPLP
jgi:hypothetical protein